jgi:hypothetical protein
LTLLAVTAGLLCGLAPASADAEHYRVTRHDDPRPGKCRPDNCSIREAIRAANRHPGRDMVVLPDRTPSYKLSRHNSGRADGTSGDLDITAPIIVRHGVRGRATIDARGVDRVIEIKAGAPTKLARINVTGGNASQASSRVARTATAGAGGGVLARARLRLVHTVVLGTRADSGGGIFSTAPLSLNHSRVRANRAAVGGGIDSHASPVMIVRSTVAANRATNAGGGLAINGDTLRLGNSTVARNTADGPGGGVYLVKADSRITKSTVNGNVAHASGAGIYQSASNLFLVNSTITRNRADATGGGVQSSVAGGVVMLNSVTVARNVANVSHRNALGGGLSAKAGTFGVVSSIIALNQAGARANDCHGAFDSFGGNLLSTMAGCRGFAGSALLAPDPRLGALQDNGGPTRTLELLSGSPAIGKANQEREPAVDQRDRARTGQPDIGAFERTN